MGRLIEGVSEKLIDCARYEFLEKGYEQASLRSIAKKVKTSTSSIYTRFDDKEGLFNFLVMDVADGFKELLEVELCNFSNENPMFQKNNHVKCSNFSHEKIINYIYNYFTEFKLIICCSSGTKYEMFIEEIVEIENKYMKQFLTVTENEKYLNGEITDDFLHLVISAYFSGLFEVVAHNMVKNEAIKYITQLREFFTAGWETVLN